MKQINVEVPDELFRDFKTKLISRDVSMKSVFLEFMVKFTYGVKNERPRDRSDSQLDGK